MTPWFYIGLGVVIAFVVNALVRKDATQRHARYRMRAKLARWIYEGRLTPVQVRRKRDLRAPKRRQNLSVVRRADAAGRGTETG
jgi:hypothetical protein